MRKIIFITSTVESEDPVMSKIAQTFAALASAGEQRIEYIYDPNLAEMKDGIVANPAEYFIIVPAYGQSKKRRFVVCAPRMSHVFSGELKDATGVMVHVGTQWDEKQVRAIARQFLHWMNGFGQSSCPPIAYPWGRPPATVRRPNRRCRPSMSALVHMPVGESLKAVRPGV